MNKLSLERRAKIVACLVEGNSINAICRITDTAKNTVLKLLADLGGACQLYQDEHLRGLNCRRIECDEIWAFCYAKQRNVPIEYQGKIGYGDIWTWTAIDADSKLIVSWHIGGRSAHDALIFMRDVASRLSNRVQLTTDGHGAYFFAVEAAFQCDVDYAQLVKIYGEDVQEQQEHRRSAAKCLGTKREARIGFPDADHISTSPVKKLNHTMRQSMRRYTRLRAGHSENHRYATALHFMHYNFARICQSIRCTPAMEAGISDRVWSIEELVSLSN